MSKYVFVNIPLPQTVVAGTLSAPVQVSQLRIKAANELFWRLDTPANHAATPISISNGHHLNAGEAEDIQAQDTSMVLGITIGILYVSAIQKSAD